MISIFGFLFKVLFTIIFQVLSTIKTSLRNAIFDPLAWPIIVGNLLFGVFLFLSGLGFNELVLGFILQNFAIGLVFVIEIFLSKVHSANLLASLGKKLKSALLFSIFYFTANLFYFAFAYLLLSSITSLFGGTFLLNHDFIAISLVIFFVQELFVFANKRIRQGPLDLESLGSSPLSRIVITHVSIVVGVFVLTIVYVPFSLLAIPFVILFNSDPQIYLNALMAILLTIFILFKIVAELIFFGLKNHMPSAPRFIYVMK